MPDALAALDGVSLRRPGSLILREVDLHLDAGEAIGVFGANGSGKTTLLQVLATLIPPTGGTGTVLGARLGSTDVEAVRPRIVLIGHEAALVPDLTLGENLRYMAELAGREPEEADAALRRVGLERAAGRKASICSNGMRRRAEFARAMVGGPDLLLLDEAHVGLDPAAGVLVEHLTGEVTARGGAVVLVSHERERVARLIDRAVELRDGRLEVQR